MQVLAYLVQGFFVWSSSEYAFKSVGDFFTDFSGATSNKLHVCCNIHGDASYIPKLPSKGYLYLFHLCGFVIFLLNLTFFSSDHVFPVMRL